MGEIAAFPRCGDTATHLQTLKSLEMAGRRLEEKVTQREISRRRQKVRTTCPVGIPVKTMARKRMDCLKESRQLEPLKHRRPEIVPVPESKRERSLMQGHQNTQTYLFLNDGVKLSLNRAQLSSYTAKFKGRVEKG